MDLFICNIFVNANATGLLSVAKAAPIILESFVAQLSGIFAPKFVELYSKNLITDLINEAKFSMKVIAFVMSAPAAFFVVFGLDFYTLWLPFKSADEVKFIYNVSMITLVPIVFISFVFSLFNLDSATNKLRRPAIANTILGVSTIIAQIALLKFSGYGVYGIVIVAAIFYSIRILGFDLINAALNLEVRLTTFYGVYFKNLAVFALCVLAMFACKDFVSLDNWLKFAIFAAIYAGAAYVLGYFLFFNAFERGIVWRKILKKFKRS